MPRKQIHKVEAKHTHWTCENCQQLLPIDDFYAKKDAKRGHFSWCKKCQNQRTKAHFEANREHHLDLIKERKWELKLEAIEQYGGKCACCGEATPHFLELDHINNDGAEFRKENKWLLGADFVRWLKRNNWPENIQLLCSNCNVAKYRYGVCPHQEKVIA